MIHLFFYLIPKNLLSFIIGWLARIQLPSALQHHVNKSFVSFFKIKIDEAQDPIESFVSLEEVFIRKLKSSVRTIDLDSDLVSPCDGFILQSKSCTGVQDNLIQAKGIYYSTSELITGVDNSSFLPEYKHFITIYLAPHNYHRVHSCVAGELEEMTHIPGQLWPVNNLLVPNFPNLYCKNERLVFNFKTEFGKVSLVMVGALNVGRMTSPFLPSQFFTNNLQSAKSHSYTINKLVAKGDEIGTFMLGSTVILLFENPAMNWKNFVQHQPIELGAPLG